VLYTAVLARHSQTGTDAIQGIVAQARRTGKGTFTVTYALKGDIFRLRIPPPQLPGRADGLWQHTCFEVFIADPVRWRISGAYLDAEQEVG